ncbi:MULTISPECIES: Pls/PosA family non-ribosomal peptide synthetase [Streptomyces]|uniref:Pls/PosA family non-ribosomal peptide synthetase n=1 Tax=Streptomyces TaxID=1883 RepID=UPI001E437C4C|nr:Pls/PosA family non-ribosomal peptide synthetase [Streptomyces ruber]
MLATVVRVDHVPVDSHFFDDLGANSLVLAHFCAKIRKRSDLPSVSMKDVYGHPTVRSLAAALTEAPEPGPERTPVQAEPVASGSSFRHALCGTLQLLVFVGYCLFGAVALTRGYEWVAAGPSATQVYLRAAFFGGTLVVVLTVLPVAAKWLLIGRARPTEFPVWSMAYLRFWTVRALLHTSPAMLLVGNPLYVVYLRALGARIGKNVTILSRSVPVAADLLTIGEGTIVRKDSLLQCYHAHAGRLRTGPVTLGRDVFVGERTVLDIDTSMGDGSQLGHSSALRPGESVPARESWHGSPAERTPIDHVRVAPTPCGTFRRSGYALASLLQVFLLWVPLAVGGLYLLFAVAPGLEALVNPRFRDIGSLRFYVEALVLSVVLFLLATVTGAITVLAVPRLLNRMIEPDKVYPLYGFHYGLHRTITRLTNIRFYKWLFGDSSYIVYYLKALGYDLSRVRQTGSNFGTELAHETPFLSSVGSGTMIADGLSLMNAEYSATSFKVTRTSIGANNFLGNAIAYPAGGRTGDNCLLATKVLVPLDGEVREGVGLLGSPAFEIPRSVERDSRFDHLREGAEFERRLRAKNRYNLKSMGMHLCLRWLCGFVLTVLGFAAVDLYWTGTAKLTVVTASMVLGLVFTVVYFALVERCILHFRPLQPELFSIYDERFWHIERLWKVPDLHLEILNGTPYKVWAWRLMGARFGKRVLDDGAYLTERTLSTVGDDCTLNAGSRLQAHSQEDGTFKSDHVRLGDGVTLGVGSLVHYGVTMGDGAELAADSFLLKGEQVPPRARWGGNPASEDRGRR